jgi:hypothetical protein
MAIMNSAMENTLDEMFGTKEWRIVKDIADSEERIEAVLKVLREAINAKWATYIRSFSTTKFLPSGRITGANSITLLSFPLSSRVSSALSILRKFLRKLLSHNLFLFEWQPPA